MADVLCPFGTAAVKRNSCIISPVNPRNKRFSRCEDGTIMIRVIFIGVTISQ